MQSLTISQALRLGHHSLMEYESPQLEAEMLLSHCLQKPRSYLYSWPEQELSLSLQAHYQQLLDRRILGEPVAYILGEREFWTLNLRVTPDVLIPRADTELLVETVLELAGDKAKFADLGTGSGAIALSVAKEKPHWRVFASDVSEKALSVAADNARRHELRNIAFGLGNWCEALPQDRFDIIASNPPYIDEQDEHLERGDLRFEPVSALVAKDNGLADIRQIAAQSRAFLSDNAWLVLEHGWTQGEQVANILTDNGFRAVRTLQDIGGNDRVTLGQWST
ncbi:MAG: peptide chain release factor N(5)-glutamine methyltransferase [Pseudohongiellaceae bacterium]|nr:peptide chain release factor N(5)-glutamine methyltransferase [Pseudohongiellaceae bacterium]